MSISEQERKSRLFSKVDWERSDFLSIGTAFGLIYRLNGQSERMQVMRTLLEQLQDYAEQIVGKYA